MLSPARVLACLPLLLGVLACVKPDSVALGGACKQQEECMDPADTCMTLGSESLCSMVCSAEAACPEGYACARMDVRVDGDDGGAKAGARGYCLADSRVGSHIATIKPKGEDKEKRKGKRKDKADAKTDAEP